MVASSKVQRRIVFVIISRVMALCEHVRNALRGPAMHPPAVRGREGGITEMYDEKIVHQGCLWGRVRSALGRVSYMKANKSVNICSHLP